MGVIVLGVFEVITLVVGLWTFFWWLVIGGYGGDGVLYSLIYLVCNLPTYLGCYYYIKWFRNNVKATRLLLPRAHFLNMITIAASTVWGIVGGYIIF